MAEDNILNFEKFDFLMLNIARECGDIYTLMNCFFSFLLRKTDFYTSSKSLEDCEKLILSILRKYYDKKDEFLVMKKEEYQKIDEERKKKKMQINNNDMKKEENNEIKINNNINKTKEKNESKKNEKEKEKRIENKKNNETISFENNQKEDNKKANDDDDDDVKPPLGNGGETEKYIWTQTLSSVDLHLKTLDSFKDIKLNKDNIKLNMTCTKLFLKIKDEIIIDAKFHKKIKNEESVWYVEENKIHFIFEKFNTMDWWPCVFQGDEEIDVKSIVPETSRIDDLDSETRSVVEKMLYDQRRKAANLPTSDEQEKYEILEKFKKMHPELDFSKANINLGGNSSNMFFPNVK